ncbi:MAG: DNA mismatch repair endonuclease MutL [Holophagales bacterium]|nr:DNA mismatch repair endonuclease MutL [Holophagales bacterium]
MSKIRMLDDHLVSQIAAGEVVERPASVVKELVENSLDAGATEVRVELEAGGKRRIVVDDDGSGMGGDDALLAFDRHATSKIGTFDDLERVGTLGFRGEALASIAAIARIEMRTAEEPGDGHLVRLEGGRVKAVEPVSHPRGTRFEVASLFFNVPARRKFLKRPETELRRSLEVVQGYALAHPGVRFTVEHEGRILMETTAQGDDVDGLRERIAQVFGRELVAELSEVPLDHIGDEESIAGFVGSRATSRNRRSFLYVNRRLVRDRILMARFYRSVRNTWHSEEYPALFLFLELRPEEVDVNVHPQKSEVRFRDSSFLDRVETALSRTLDLARREGSAPLGSPRSLPGLPATWEGLGSQRGGDQPYTRRDVDPAEGGEVREAGELEGAPTPAAAPGGSGEAPWWRTPPAENVEEKRGAYRRLSGSTGFSPPEGQPITPIARPTYRPIEPRAIPLSGRGKHLAPFRLLGQYKGSLILLEGHDGLYLVDQHAAHERILYERLRSSMAEREPPSQRLLEPVMLELSTPEALRLGELAEALESCGFGIAPMSGGSVAITSIPSVLGVERAEAIVQSLATAEAGGTAGGSGEEGGEGEVAAVRRRLLEGLAADMSCKAAIKIHRPMGPEEMEALVSELFAAEQPYACPHGRPTVLTMGDGELERRFGRRG